MNNINKSYESKMGLIDTKIVDSTANVVNKLESDKNDLELIHTLLIIIVVIMCANCFYKLYKLQKKMCKKEIY